MQVGARSLVSTLVFLWSLTPSSAFAQTDAGLASDAARDPQPVAGPWSGRGCTAAACHAGLEPIRDLESEMMRRLRERGADAGDADGCVTCHGGDPAATVVELAHAGAPASLTARGGPDDFFPDPGSPWVNNRSCGQCHEDLVNVQWQSLMMTEAGKVQGTAWSFGGLEGMEHGWANYDVARAELARLGTPTYRAIMDRRRALLPGVYPDRQTALPAAPTAAEAEAHPERAAFTYLRDQCQRCHLGVRGRQRRGDYRGMGCSGCHIPYGNEGLYEGGDRVIPRGEPGHLLVHRIQATRDASVEVNGQRYTGIPIETCTTCHNRGKRIGVSYQGLMESAYDSPFVAGGGGQVGLHSKHYIQLSSDVHYQRGMLCQDCHTSLDVHGDGTLRGTTLAAVEIECTDCHGTPEAFPWELPLEYGDELHLGPQAGSPRGVSTSLLEHADRARVYPVEDGYLLSARGNPMRQIVRRGDHVIVHTAGGEDLDLSPLKVIRDRGDLSLEATVAMVRVSSHVQHMECYSCHSSWAPQCYGCHVEVSYQDGATGHDWVAAGQAHAQPAHRTARGEQGALPALAGRTTESRSYLRWEDPMLGVNGEGRVTPLIPGCQTSVTVIGRDGRDVIRNHIFRTPAGTEGGGDRGQLAIDMSPVQPHTTGKARSCESCHGSSKAAGYGIGDALDHDWSRGSVVDLASADGRVLPRSARFQVEPVEGLEHDWSAIVTPGGEQLQTVGHHFPLSGPLSERQRMLLDRSNVCLGCHREIPANSLAVSLLHHVAEATGQLPETAEEHASLLHKIALTSAWAQVLGALSFLGLGLGLGAWWRRKRR
ncbi:MAG: cytochrome c3 family protein [Deltaproteobacteria bacterium]|nr:cytochrome c3 family protein [Deltaproteobacteria bacterium]